ncbi:MULTISPECIES: Crp/Fnr family transcriptional regulator [unclassified Sphingomonas]|uniref:Crp/Fnr family transcriptional regulator n=1 Tax=unclassified Sphingomonas TaxID=196159 RepID=UPI001F55D73E|nr:MULTISPECIES: Crp/Fnr family transcriptional regulator [unclassified Sphingomonas]
MTRSIGASKDFVRESDSADHVHIVLEGWAYRYKLTRDGRRQIVALLIPGDTANPDTILLKSRGYGLRTLTPVKVLSMPRERLLVLAEKHPGIAKTIAWLAMIDSATLSQLAVCLGRRSAKQRIAHLLCELSERLRSGDDTFEMPLTQEVIADTLGLTSVHVNRTLQLLRSEGLIEPGKRVMTITDADALCRLGDFDPDYLHDPRAGSTGSDAAMGFEQSNSGLRAS